MYTDFIDGNNSTNNSGSIDCTHSQYKAGVVDVKSGVMISW